MLDQLTSLARQLEAAQTAVDVLRAERDVAIREAIDAGHAAVRVAEAAGVSKQGLYNALSRANSQPPNSPSAQTPK